MQTDNIVFIIKENTETLKKLFNTYFNFSKISGIELNTTKTEILRLGNKIEEKECNITGINEEDIAIKSIEAIKVCGITISYNQETAYQLNITDKITKLKSQIKRWLWRGLSLEGKIMTVKTFGLSQLIYFLQCCKMKERDIIKVETTIFKFLNNKKWQGKCPDRIKRQVLKNS